MITRSGTTPSCSLANQFPVAAETALHLVGHEHDLVLGAPALQRREKTGSRNHEAALALYRLDDHRRHVAGADLGRDHLQGPGGGLLPQQATVPERIGHRRPVDLAGEGPEALLVRHVLRRHRHGQVGPAVVGVIENDHRRPPRGNPGDLHRVLHRLGAGVEQRRLLGVLTGGHGGQLLAHPDVPLVRRDHEAGVAECRDLMLHGRHHPWCRVPDTGHGNSGTQIDQRVAVHVGQHAARGRSTKIGSTVPTPPDTVWFRRANSSRDPGPGISVTNRRRCSTGAGVRSARVVIAHQRAGVVVVGDDHGGEEVPPRCDRRERRPDPSGSDQQDLHVSYRCTTSHA